MKNSCCMPAKSYTLCNNGPSASYILKQNHFCVICWNAGKRNVRIALNFVIQTSMFRPSTFPTFVLRFLLRNVHQVLTLTLYANVSSILSVNMVRHLQLIAEKCLQPLLRLADRAVVCSLCCGLSAVRKTVVARRPKTKSGIQRKRPFTTAQKQ